MGSPPDLNPRALPQVTLVGRSEAALIQGIDVYPVETLARLVTHFRNYHPIEPCRAALDLDAEPRSYAADFQNIKG